MEIKLLEIVLSAWFISLFVIATIIVLVVAERPCLMSFLTGISIWLMGSSFNFNWIQILLVIIGYIVIGILYAYFYWNKVCGEAVEKYNGDSSCYDKKWFNEETNFSYNTNKVASVVFSWSVDIIVDIGKFLFDIVKNLFRGVLKTSFEKIAKKHRAKIKD